MSSKWTIASSVMWLHVISRCYNLYGDLSIVLDHKSIGFNLYSQPGEIRKTGEIISPGSSNCTWARIPISPGKSEKLGKSLELWIQRYTHGFFLLLYQLICNTVRKIMKSVFYRVFLFMTVLKERYSCLRCLLGRHFGMEIQTLKTLVFEVVDKFWVSVNCVPTTKLQRKVFLHTFTTLWERFLTSVQVCGWINPVASNWSNKQCLHNKRSNCTSQPPVQGQCVKLFEKTLQKLQGK